MGARVPIHLSNQLSSIQIFIPSPRNTSASAANAMEHCQCSHTSHGTISSKGLATNFPSRNLFNDNLTRVSSGSNFTTVHPTVNMAPASRSTATARAKSAKSADQDYVLRNKHKVRGKKTGAVDKLLLPNCANSVCADRIL